MQPTNDEGEIRGMLETLARALRAKDVDALMVHYDPEVITFDVQPPLHVQGAAYRKNFERWFGSVDGPIDYEMSNLTLAAAAEVAFCGYLGHVRSKRPSGETVEYWVRVTSCFRKAHGAWKITHEHVSMPIDMATMRATPGE